MAVTRYFLFLKFSIFSQSQDVRIQLYYEFHEEDWGIIRGNVNILPQAEAERLSGSVRLRKTIRHASSRSRRRALDCTRLANISVGTVTAQTLSLSDPASRAASVRYYLIQTLDPFEPSTIFAQRLHSAGRLASSPSGTAVSTTIRPLEVRLRWDYE